MGGWVGGCVEMEGERREERGRGEEGRVEGARRERAWPK